MSTATEWTGNTMGGERPRNANDFYATPAPLADAICAQLRATIGDVAQIVEPSAGAGAFVRAARAVWPSARIDAVEPFQEPSVLLAAGATSAQRSTWEMATLPPAVAWFHPHRPALVIGNPPFLLAEEHAKIALDCMAHFGSTVPRPHYLAFLLRASFLAGAKRIGGLWRTAPPRYVWHIAPRPSFTGDGKTDGAEYAVIVWQAGHRGPYEGGWLTWRKDGGT